MSVSTDDTTLSSDTIPVSLSLDFSFGYKDDPESIYGKGGFKYDGRIPKDLGIRVSQSSSTSNSFKEFCDNLCQVVKPPAKVVIFDDNTLNDDLSKHLNNIKNAFTKSSGAKRPEPQNTEESRDLNTKGSGKSEVKPSEDPKPRESKAKREHELMFSDLSKAFVNAIFAHPSNIPVSTNSNTRGSRTEPEAKESDDVNPEVEPSDDGKPDDGKSEDFTPSAEKSKAVPSIKNELSNLSKKFSTEIIDSMLEPLFGQIEKGLAQYGMSESDMDQWAYENKFDNRSLLQTLRDIDREPSDSGEDNSVDDHSEILEKVPVLIPSVEKSTEDESVQDEEIRNDYTSISPDDEDIEGQMNMVRSRLNISGDL